MVDLKQKFKEDRSTAEKVRLQRNRQKDLEFRKKRKKREARELIYRT